MRNVIICIFIVTFLFSACEKEQLIVNDIYYTWVILDFLSVESVVYTKEEKNKILIIFNPDGSYVLKLDVNTCHGIFTMGNENELEITGPGCTKICCDSDFSIKVAQMLSRVSSYDLEDNQLKLNVKGWGWLVLELD